MGILVAAFGGMQPIVDPTLLADNYAVLSQNAWLYSGAIIGLPIPQAIHTLSRPDIGKVYRIPKSYKAPADFANSYWLEFPNFDTDVVRSPVFGEKFDRYYSASEARPPLYNTVERIAAGQDPFLLGVPAPPTAPEVTREDGVSGVSTSRAYVYTWVSAYGEEGPPSPPTLVNGFVDDTWTIKAFNPPGLDRGTRRNLTHYRIYRTVVSISGVPDYYLVAELPLSPAGGGVLPKYVDTFTDDQLTSRTILQSTDWSPPPEDLVGFCMMPNGILAGWRESEMWFSEPYRPHAWPAAHTQLTEFPIVGMGVQNQTLVVCTQGFPVLASGVTPLAIVTSKLTLFEPCTSRGSIVSAPEGVYYASSNGLVLVSAEGAILLTAKLIAKDQWQQLQKRKKFRAARLSTGYYGLGAVITGAFQTDAFQLDAFQQTDDSGSHEGLLFDMSDPRLALNKLYSELPVYGVQNDPWTDEVFILRNGQVQFLNMGAADEDDAPIMTEPVVWTSKLFQTDKPRNYQAMKVYFTVPPGTPAPPAVRDTALVQTLGTKWGIIRFFCDEPAEDTLIATFELRQSAELMRLPADRKYDYCCFQLESRVRIRRVMIAETVKELAAA